MEIIVNTNKLKIEFDKTELFEMFQNHTANVDNYIKKGKREEFYQEIADKLKDKNYTSAMPKYENMSLMESLISLIIDDIIHIDNRDVIGKK